MKRNALFKTLFVSLLALGGLAAGPAAAQSCSLALNTSSNPIAVGQSYTLTVRFLLGVDFSPPRPLDFQYQVIFHGTRNSVSDTGSGQHLMNVLGRGQPSTATGYNPGGIPGQYVRFAEIRTPPPFSQSLCFTNVISGTFL